MRTLVVLLALILVAGCRVTPTAPTSIQPDAVSWQAPPHASEWLVRHYEANDKYSEVRELTCHTVGDQLVLEARFTDAPAPIGDDWFGTIGLSSEADWRSERLEIRFGPNAGPSQTAPVVWRLHSGGGGYSSPLARAVLHGPVLVATCDRAILDFTPKVIRLTAVAYPRREFFSSEFAKTYGVPGPVASVER